MKHIANQSIGLLFFGRFEQEKGIDILSDLIDIASAHPILNKRLVRYCFGDGSQYSSFLAKHNNNQQVHCFGWKPLHEIFRYRDNIHYTIMPSRFLESFGKSALESLHKNIPVVGFRKGGLKEFVLPECELPANRDEWVRFLLRLVDNVDNRVYIQYQQTIQQIAQRYTQEEWMRQFRQYAEGRTYVALVSDFVQPIGGIETYCHEVATLLSSQGCRVGIFGLMGTGRLFSVRKTLGMVGALYNFVAKKMFIRFLKQEERDIIWFHSVLRYLGWLPLAILRKRKGRFVWWMMHDFGYLHPFASKVQQESDLPREWSVDAFVASAGQIFWHQRLMIIIKFWLLNKIRKHLLRVCDRFFVPSGYIKEHLVRLWGVDAQRVSVFPHFFNNYQ